MTAIGARLITRWALPDHDGLTTEILDAAVTAKRLTPEERAQLV